ncbi:T-cell ecto-ADP-ribosyltransferase 2-like [Sphaeramia orbicularis]|uniref:T-cell ecto-ADP-ribosyltransferase 2-like n=1 Tax=Sphaeramia orbicularis TaxID=375764 RepID=UPI00117E2ABA|nr:T-cell ecto-ADP-ribosyltransferase 2-like [Sphaeramia orbicularis]XP_030002726.1 T-cell ecto-ADP-ribosyltransferase 2-like [Sphaeramia orbicularis]
MCETKSLMNWATFCLLLVVVLLLCRDPFLILWWPQNPAEDTMNAVLPLDMATDSVDDMFDGCRSDAAAVIDLFGVFEWHINGRFSFAWALAERKVKKPVRKPLKEDHAVVLHIYTREKLKHDFNRAVKKGKNLYNTAGFKFHYFYFYLIDAIQVLRQNQTKCRTTYYRTGRYFHHSVINTKMRFGSFIWATSSKNSPQFTGNISCFEIYTCFGADITNYSAIKQQGQTLIPPYEVFQITDILTKEKWCSNVYKLRSTETPKSDLNCKLNKKQIKKYLGFFPTNWHPSISLMMSICITLLLISSLVLIKRRQKSFVAVVLGALMVVITLIITLRIMMD